MRTYYRGNDAVVTSELFVRRTTSAESFAIRDMRNVCIACDAGNGRSKLLIATTAGFLCLSATAAAWTVGSWYALFPLAIAVPITLGAALTWRREPTRWELRAQYRGHTVTLYTSCEVRVFNQVARALRRAIEADRRPPAWQEGDAA
jgi:hypothetical protein